MSDLVRNKIDRLWVDIESTGLRPEADIMLEIGLAVGDVYGNIGSRFQSLIWTASFDLFLDRADDIVKEMHDTNGLREELEALSNNVDQAVNMFTTVAVQQRIMMWIRDLELPEKKLKMAGSSIHFDRGFIRRNMPMLDDFCHYRNVDVSTIKTVCEGLNPELFAKLADATKPQKKHRVNPDIDDTVAEYKFYVDNFFWWDEPIPDMESKPIQHAGGGWISGSMGL